MSKIGTFTKQPAEKESYSIDYEDDLEASDGIFSAISAIDGAGLTLVSKSIFGTRVKVILLGGTVGTKYKVTVTATTNDGRILQDEFFVNIKEF